jgi:DNA invertase Pin-like site-specific DNA recombinase/DNA-binding CsgD family transcriptional regulator
LGERLPEFTFEDNLPVVAGYLRVSTDIQVDEGHSLETQPIYIREACTKRFPDGCHIIWIADEGLSGTLPYRRDGLRQTQYRPGLTLVTELIEQGLVQFVCVYKCNRFCRSLRIWLEFEEDYLQKYNAEFFSATEPVDNRTIAGKFIADLIMATASYERDQILQITNHGRQARRAEGYYMGGGCYGWEWEDCSLLAPKQRRNIRPIIEQAKVVRQIVHWFLSGRYIPWIVRQLEDLGIQTVTGKQTWSYRTVLYILMNPVHCGYIINADGKYERGVHYDLRIIEESTYWAIVKRRKDTATISTSRERPAHGIFVELCRCGICGKRIHTSNKKWHEPRYECRAETSEHKHKSYQVPIEDVDKWITQRIQDTFASPELRALSDRELHNIIDEDNDGLEAAQAHFQSESERLVEESRNWSSLYTNGAIDDATYEMYAEELTHESESLQTRLVDIERQLERSGAKQARLNFALDILNGFDDAFEVLDRDEKLGLSWNVIEELVFRPHDDYVDIHLRLINGSNHYLQLPVLGPWASKASRLSSDILSTAYCLLQGHSNPVVAEMRCIPTYQVHNHLRAIERATGADRIQEALERIKPEVERRISELHIVQSSSFGELNETETSLLRILAAGKTRNEAAEELSCSIGHINSLLRSIYKKLNVHDAKSALALGLEHGLVEHLEVNVKRPTKNELSHITDILNGKSRNQIAVERGFELSYVNKRFSQMYRRFGVHNIDELLNLFNEKGWL